MPDTDPLRFRPDEERAYEETASHRDLLAIQEIVESDAEVPRDRANRLTRLGWLEEGELTESGRRVYRDAQEQRDAILTGLREGRVLPAADLRDHRGGRPGKVPLVQFADAGEDEGTFNRAVANWMRLRDELRTDRDSNSYLLA